MSKTLQKYEPKGAQPVVTRLASIDTIKHNLKIHLEGFEEAKRRMPMHAIAAGLWLLNLKDVLPHGEFMEWCEQNIDVKDRQANKFMQLAGFFLEYSKLQKAETLLLTDGKLSADEKKQRTSIEKMLVEFVGDNSQADLFEKYGKSGSPEKLTKHQTPEHIRLYYQRQYGETLKHLDELTRGGADTDMKWLESNEVVACYTKLEEFAVRLRGEIKRRQQKKN